MCYCTLMEFDGFGSAFRLEEMSTGLLGLNRLFWLKRFLKQILWSLLWWKWFAHASVCCRSVVGKTWHPCGLLEMTDVDLIMIWSGVFFCDHSANITPPFSQRKLTAYNYFTSGLVPEVANSSQKRWGWGCCNSCCACLVCQWICKRSSDFRHATFQLISRFPLFQFLSHQCLHCNFKNSKF